MLQRLPPETGRSRPRLVVLCRGGRASLPVATWDQLEAVADVRLVQRDDAPFGDEAVALLQDADLIGATNLCLPRVDSELLDALPRLRGIVLYATGYDRFDLPELERRGVGLSVLPDYATIAVSEHAVALLLGLTTRLHLGNDRSRGLAAPGTSLRGVELAGRTLGVVGVGRIGTRVAQLARGLGLRVLGHDIDPAAEALARAAGIDMVDLSSLLRQCDAVVVCASAEHDAGPVLGPGQLALLGMGAHIVNVSRPELVDTGWVVAALRSGRLRGYAVDDVVVDADRDGDVLAQGRLLQTGHSAWWRDEVLERGAQMWGDRLLAAVLGRPLDVVTWPETAGPVSAGPVSTGTRAAEMVGS